MLRPAVEADRDTVLRWRNHPVVREASLDTHKITADEHAAWWKRSHNSDDRYIYIYELDGIPCGVVTFTDVDLANKTGYWGYYLDNEGLDSRGALMQAWMKIQLEAVEVALSDLGLTALRSEVLEANAGVLAFNRRNGCREVGRRVDSSEAKPREVVELLWEYSPDSA